MSPKLSGKTKPLNPPLASITPSHTNDLIIVGAGINGLTLANLCANKGFSVALIEKNPKYYPTAASESLQASSLQTPKNPNTVSADRFPLYRSLSSFDLRCFAISRSSQKVFETLNIWQDIKQLGASAYSQMKVWDAAGFGEIEFKAEDIHEPDLGYIIEERVLMQALWKNTLHQENITLFLHQQPVDWVETENNIVLTLEDNQQLTTQLIIGAEGANSWVRNKARIEIEQKPYEQTALVATVETEHPHQYTAWQRFMPSGPLAFLPLSNPNLCSIVWTNTNDNTEQNLNLSAHEFCKAVEQAFDYKLGSIKACSERKSFPLTRMHAKNYIKQRIALVGDAAHVVHPLAGQGINLGLQDARALCDILTTAKLRDCDIGQFLILRKYERARKSEVGRMMMNMNLLNELFGTASESVATVRSLGLNIVNSIPYLKRQLIKTAMGIS